MPVVYGYLRVSKNQVKVSRLKVFLKAFFIFAIGFLSTKAQTSTTDSKCVKFMYSIKCGLNLDTLFRVELCVELYACTPYLTSIANSLACPMSSTLDNFPLMRCYVAMATSVVSYFLHSFYTLLITSSTMLSSLPKLKC